MMDYSDTQAAKKKKENTKGKKCPQKDLSLWRLESEAC